MAKLGVWLPISFVTFECDEVQQAGPTLIVWGGGKCLAQFTQWVGFGWLEGVEGVKPQREPFKVYEFKREEVPADPKGAA